jgi:hypothetical protein
MKTNAQKLGIVLITLAAAFVGCTKENMRPMQKPSLSEESATPYNLDEKNIRTEWRISSFYSQKVAGAKDYTNLAYKFKGWLFVFDKSGVVYATKNNEQVIGSWKNGTSTMREGIVIYFGTQVPFSELNNEWRVVKNDRNSKVLQDRDESDGSVGSLVFDRNISISMNK